MSKLPSLELPARTRLSRRDLLGLAAKGAASVVVSQSLLACAAGASGGTDTASLAANAAMTTGSPSGAPACVLTAALTEGPFFVDEKLNRADIRTDPVTGAASTGVPLALTFNVARVANNACTPLTGAYVDVCDVERERQRDTGGGCSRHRVGPNVRPIQLLVDEERAFGVGSQDAGGRATRRTCRDSSVC